MAARRRTIVLLLGLVAGVGAVACQPAPGGTTYYVSSRGNDARAGTSPDTAWRYLSRVNYVDLQPGDRILLEGGAEHGGSLLLGPEDAGTPSAPITIQSYGTGRATVDPGTANGIVAYNVGGIVVRNVNVAGSGRTTNSGSGITFYNDLPGDVVLPHIRVSDVDVHGFQEIGLRLGGGAGRSGYRDVVFERVKAYGNGRAGIGVSGAAFNVNKDVHVRSSQAYDNPGRADDTLVNSGSGIVLGSVDGASIRSSKAYRNGGLNAATQGAGAGIWTYNSTRVLIEHNESYDNRTGTTKDGDGFDLDNNVTYSTLQYNFSHGNDGSGFLLAHVPSTTAHHHNTVRYNVSANDGRKNAWPALAVFGAVRNAEIHNNTVWMSSPGSLGRAVQVWNFGTTAPNDAYAVHFRNNIISTTGTGVRQLEVGSDQVAGAVDLRFQGNDWYSGGATPSFRWGSTSYTSLSAWRNATGQEKVDGSASGRSDDPKLVAPGAMTAASYQLQSGSPMINAGLNLSGKFGVNPGPVDHFGGSIPKGGALDIGAHERA